MNPLEYVVSIQTALEPKLDLKERKSKGQYFTPASVSEYMAQLVGVFPDRWSLLDPGAGLGILSAAICNRVLGLRRSRELHIELYEKDCSLVPYLEKNMMFCAKELARRDHKLSFTIHSEDFVLKNAPLLNQHNLFDDRVRIGMFDTVIMNPPYFKIGRKDKYAQLMSHVVHGQPNIYALFMALASELMRPGGTLVAITPRSFCNGAYFRHFRKWFLERMALHNIHVFGSRTDTFRESNVLQESIITRFEKNGIQPKRVTISTSFGRDMSSEYSSLTLPSKYVIDSRTDESIICIPASKLDVGIMKQFDTWTERMEDLGLGVSTGPVVSFRAKKFLVHDLSRTSIVPLLSIHNVKPFLTAWPLQKNGKAQAFEVCKETSRLLLPMRNYVLLRRFSAKEEQRRLVASNLLKSEFGGEYVALENHLNYIYHKNRDLTDDEVYGLTAIFNSVLFDCYFRTVSGNTQVNATELRSLTLPSLMQITQIGRRVRKMTDRKQSDIERIVWDELNVKDSLRKDLGRIEK